MNQEINIKSRTHNQEMSSKH